ncbi:MAG: glutathionylspermidine synthase family protein [Ectobacillus sp.]
MNKADKRTSFYNTIPQFWPDLYGEAYALYDVYYLSDEQKRKLHEATARAGSIFFKTARLLRQLDEETLLAMSYPKEAIPFMRMSTSLPESVIARLDFVEHEGTFKVLELNADTPTFIKEVYHVNGKVCAHFQAANVNEGEEEHLRKAVRLAIVQEKAECQSDEPYIVFTAHEENIEDRFTSMYLQELYGEFSRFVPLEKLQIAKGQGLFDEYGRRIDILYRQTFPIEGLLLDRDEDGERIGLMLLELAMRNKVRLINPPSAFLLQNKAVQAVIWGLYEEKHPFFTEEEQRWIQAYFLPTYLEDDVFVEKELPYVKKPTFGREGDTVEIYNNKGEKTMEDTHKSYEDYGFVYQQYVDLPIIETDINGERKKMHQMYGSFLLNGRPSSIGCRVGGQITNNLSCYLPLGMKQNEIV